MCSIKIYFLHLKNLSLPFLLGLSPSCSRRQKDVFLSFPRQISPIFLSTLFLGPYSTKYNLLQAILGSSFLVSFLQFTLESQYHLMSTSTDSGDGILRFEPNSNSIPLPKCCMSLNKSSSLSELNFPIYK